MDEEGSGVGQGGPGDRGGRRPSAQYLRCENEVRALPTLYAKTNSKRIKT